MSDMDEERRSWQDMQQVIATAQRRPTEVMAAVADAPDRESAAAVIADLLGCEAGFANQVLDVRLATFIGGSS
jgi:alkylhydroperoxidase family enzyme